MQGLFKAALESGVNVRDGAITIYDSNGEQYIGPIQFTLSPEQLGQSNQDHNCHHGSKPQED